MVAWVVLEEMLFCRLGMSCCTVYIKTLLRHFWVLDVILPLLVMGESMQSTTSETSNYHLQAAISHKLHKNSMSHMTNLL